MTTPGQYGGPGDPTGADGPTRPVSAPGGYPQHGPGGTQYGPPAGQGGYGGSGQFPPPGQGQYGGPGHYGQPGQHGQPGQPGQQGQYGQQGGPGGWPQQPGGWPAGGGPGQFSPPPRKANTGLVIGLLVAAIVLVGGVGAAWYFLAGPGSEDEPSRTPTASGPATTGSSAPSVPASPSAGPGVLPGADAGGDVSIDVEIGECITLGGTITDATAEPATCGSPESNYKVIAKTETNAECPTDSDQTFYETLAGSELGALCLDIDWVEGDCFELSGGDPQRVPCTQVGAQTVRVLETIQGDSDISACTSGDGGFSYPERRFVVCAEQL